MARRHQSAVLGFGGAEIGDGHAAQAAVDRLLGEALDAGLHVIDTAECDFDSDALIGGAAAPRRHEIYFLTKCGHASGLDLPDWRTRTSSRPRPRGAWSACALTMSTWCSSTAVPRTCCAGVFGL
jgi:aryl-alcohol dehydrogenase-like predicted oxidoreductase